MGAVERHHVIVQQQGEHPAEASRVAVDQSIDNLGTDLKE